MQKNERLILTAVDYSEQGVAVCKHEGFVVFVKGMLVGEVADVLIMRVNTRQAFGRLMEVIEPMLTEEEHSVYRRGRNAHSPTMAKHATMADYRRATGFEALMGYLYLKDDFSRIIELVRAGIGEDKI